jgi:hypothetical protein
MNKKGLGEFAIVGTLITAFVAVIFAVAFLTGGIASNVGLVTQTVPYGNHTVTFPANTSLIVLEGQAVKDVVVTNVTSGALITADNYTITNYDGSTGTLRSTLTAKASKYSGASTNISYTFEPVGYATDSGSRSVIGLIVLFACLALVAYVIYIVYQNGVSVFGK